MSSLLMRGGFRENWPRTPTFFLEQQELFLFNSRFFRCKFLFEVSSLLLHKICQTNTRKYDSDIYPVENTV
jgi:hypothetical protein